MPGAPPPGPRPFPTLTEGFPVARYWDSVLDDGL